MRRKLGLLRVLLRLVCLCCVIYVIWYAGDSLIHRQSQSALSARIPAGREEMEGGKIFFRSNGGKETVLPRYRELYEENSDLAGWLTIEGTRIDYPVMRSADDEFYLSHNFQGEKDRYGSLFIRSRVDILNPGTNVIVYGHNMKDGAMFGELDKYRDETYCRQHPEIRFDTLYEEKRYEVVGAFEARVLKEGEDGFRYYDFYQADTEEAFREFYQSVKEQALYDTGVTAGYGDSFLTLSTCYYHTEDGRFVVVARARGSSAR